MIRYPFKKIKHKNCDVILLAKFRLRFEKKIEIKLLTRTKTAIIIISREH